ncbi:MAG: hypothetical protein KKG76_02210 [Euryarchaeota archaeon]|nr:hypothetical protein [Euryarchaeota archaeon]
MKKGLLKNNEGISPVLGFILMLAIGVTILSTVQMTFVPVWNTDEELSHLKIMQDDFKVLKSNIENGILGGTTLSSPLIMGFKYSPKVLVYNPREEAYASLEVKKDAWVELRYNEVFPEGMTDDTSIKNVSTGMMVYALQGARNYNYFIYENGLIRRSGTNYTTSSQTVLANNTIFLPSVKALEYGTLSGVEKKSINIYPTSQQKNSVIGKNVWIILHTNPDYVEWWANTLENEGADVKKKDPLNGLVIANVSTSLIIKMGEAYISSSQKAAPPLSPAWRLVKVSSSTTKLPVDGVTDIVVEVQDEYNNPVPNVLVSFNENLTKGPSNSYLNGDLLSLSAVSGADGRASVPLMTAGAGFYYVDAVIPEYTTTFAYSASSQGYVMELVPAYYSADYYNVTATLKDSLGNPVPDGTIVDFDTSDGSIIPAAPSTVSGMANTTLNISNANGTSITNIQVKDTASNTTNITWDTINNIIVTAKSGYVFNSKAIRTTISTSGCVMYGTSPGIYPYTSACDTGSSHSASLTGLTPNTAYYFIVNSSRPGKEAVNSTEYMFVTEGTDDDTPPASVTNLINVTYEPLYIRWTWIDPADADFDHVDVKIDDVSIGTVAKGIQSFNATYLMPNSAHNISIRTVDTSNNVNSTWVTHNATTKSLFTYVVDYEIYGSQGTVTDFPNAQSATDGGAAALFNETQLTGTSDRNNYTYVTSYSATNGTVTNFANMQSNVTGAFANLTEGAGTGGGGGSTSYYATSSPTGHTNVIGAPNNIWDSVDRTRITGSSFASGGSGTITKVVLKYYYSITNFGGDIATVGYTLNSGGDTIAKTENGNVIYNYPNPKYILDITSALGTWTWPDVQSLTLWLYVTKVGPASTMANVDAFEVNVTTSSSTTYSLNINTDTASVPDDTNHYLEINYSRDAADTYGVYVWDGTDWNNRSSLNASVGTWAIRNISLNPSEYNSGNPQVRYIDEKPMGTSQGNISIDYQRIHGYTPGIPGGYHLDVRTNTSGIPAAANQKLELRYNATGDNFTLQLYNGSSFSWDDKETLNKSAMTLVEVPLTADYLLSDGNFGPYTVNDLPRYYVLVRYEDNRNAGPGGKLYLDYQRVYSW